MGRRSLTIDEQVDALRPSVSGGLARNLTRWLLGGAALLAVVALVTWNPIPLLVALFLGIVGLGDREAGPNLAAAVRAYDQREPTDGLATVSVEPGDTIDHYRVTVRQDGHPALTYGFIPQRWTPVAGAHPARVWRSDDGELVMAATDDGLMIPRARPEPDPAR